MLLNSKEIPKGYSAYGHQVAGHRFETGNQGMLLDCDGKLLKPIQAPPRGKQEVEFYQAVFGQKTPDPALAKLQQFVPTFYGIKHIVHQDMPLEDQDKYIVLENLTRDFDKPCILDVKIGKCVTDHLATQAKRERAAGKYPELEKFGFRILGMKIFSKSCKNYKFHDKSFGKNLKTHIDVLTGLKEFLQEDDYGTTHIELILEHLKMIKFWALDQRLLRLYSSSVLIIYEGGEQCNSKNVANASLNSLTDNKIPDSYSLKQSLKSDCCSKKKAVASRENEETCNLLQNLSLEVNGSEESREMQDSCKNPNSKLQKPKVSIHLVDFAHTYIGHYQDADENYIYGLCNLIDYFEEIIKTRQC